MASAYSSSTVKSLTRQVRFKDGVNSETLSGNATLTAKSSNFQFLDPGGSNRNVTLPAEESSNGLFFFVINEADAAENLVVKDDGGSTIVTVNQSEWAIVACNGTAWYDVPFSALADYLATSNTWTALQTFSHASGISTNTITERSAASGVTVDGCLIKDNLVQGTNITDPGNAGAIAVTHSGSCPIVTAGAETRTLAIPTGIGQVITLYFKTDGGDCVITVASAINAAGNTIITLNDANDSVTLRGVHNGTALCWRVMVNDGATLS